MKKSIIKSIRPQHVCNILNLIKTIEMDKSAPKEWIDYLNGKTKEKPAPREVLIYCTKENSSRYNRELLRKYDDVYLIDKIDYKTNNSFLNGKVVAKFILNKVEKTRPFFHWCEELQKQTCLTRDEALDYLDKSEYITAKKQRIAYAWHIDNLEVFDEPKELRDVIYKPASEKWLKEIRERNKRYGTHEVALVASMLRAPQSWCYCLYIEDEEED